MRTRLRSLRLRDVALFAVVTALVAVGGVFAARWSGLDGVPAAATDQPLTLKLSATQQICETDHAARISGGESWKDEDGTWHEKLTVYGWGRVPTVPVRWQVSGGQAPYTLVIDYEKQDEHRGYFGGSGVAHVGCADASVGTSFWWGVTEERLYYTDPKVDSGWKTVNAVATDANGDTAQASTEFYVILNATSRRDHPMRGGETYRVYGHLMTAPEGTTLEIGELGFTQDSTIQTFILVGTGATVLLNASTYEEVNRWLPEVTRAGAEGQIDINKALDQLVDSIGKLPDLSRTGQ